MLAESVSISYTTDNLDKPKSKTTKTLKQKKSRISNLNAKSKSYISNSKNIDFVLPNVSLAL